MLDPPRPYAPFGGLESLPCACSGFRILHHHKKHYYNTFLKTPLPNKPTPFLENTPRQKNNTPCKKLIYNNAHLGC
jgi:hypothetical protein